jgi:hypothetical protein
MDPNQTLRDLRALVDKILDGNAVDHDDANALAEKFDDLDGWLSRKGLLPQDWS